MLLADAPSVTDAVGVTVTVVEPLNVVEEVGEGVPVPVPVAVIVGVAVPVPLSVLVPLKELEPVLEADAPDVSNGVGDELVVLLALRVDEGVFDDVPVPEPVGVLVTLPVGVCVGVAVALKEAEPVLLADAPIVTEAVGDVLKVVEALVVEVGVTDAVPVPEPVPVEVGVPVLVGLAVRLLENDGDPVLEAEAPGVSDGVDEVLAVELPLKVVVAEIDAVPMPVLVGMSVGVPVGA